MKLLVRMFSVVLLLFAVSLSFGQEPVLLGQYTNPDNFDASRYGGQQAIYYDVQTGNIATGINLDNASLNAIVSTDGGDTWQTSEQINVDGEVRRFCVTGHASTPIYIFSKRNDGDNSQPPWARHRTYIAVDDFGWGGGSFSTSLIAAEGTEEDVLDAYTANGDVSAFDSNLMGVMAAHGSSQSGGEYHQFFCSVDGGQTWSDRIKVVSSADPDSLSDFYVDDLTYNAADFHYGPDGYVLAAGTGQYAFDFEAAEHLFYTFSTDSGQTWGPVEMVPGSEDINVDWSYADRGHNLIIDSDNNFHLFALGEDVDGVWASYDFKWDGTTWTKSRIVEPQLIDNGLVAIEEVYSDGGPLNAPTLNTDGTLFYSYIDVVDTTGGDYQYEMFTIFSEDGGASWSEPRQLITNPDFNADEVSDVAHQADGALHVVYCTLDTTGGDDVLSLYYEQVDVTDLMTSIDDPAQQLVDGSYQLFQNYPNPFNPATTIRFYLPERAQISLEVFDINGKKVARLLNKALLNTGSQEVVWNAADFSSGIYFYKLTSANGRSITKKMILVK